MKLYRYLLIGAAIGLSAACSDDKGNYDYHDINEVSVTGIESGKWYTKVAFVDHLAFDPQIVSTMGKNDETAYEYEWKLIPRGKDFNDIPDVEQTVVSHERKLDLPLTQTPGDYSGFFIVTDKETGVSWTTGFFVRIKSMTSEGWMVLCEEQGQSRMDIIFNVSEEEDLIAHDIWNEQEFKPGKPLRLIYNYSLYETVSLLVTDKGTYNLDAGDLHAGEDNDLKWRFGVIPESVRLTASAISQFSVSNYWIIVDDEHNVYTLDKKADRSVFEFPVNYIDGKTLFEPAPFVGVSFDSNYSGGYGCAPAVLYDATNRQFLLIRNNSSYPSVMTFSGSQLFSVQTGRDMVHMESTKPGVIYALLKDPADGRFWFYGMKLRANYTEPAYWWEEGEYEEYNVQEYYGEASGAGLESATLFACHHLYPYLFYAAGDKVYQFDMGHPDTPAKEVLSFPGEEIKVLKFNAFTAWEAYADWERARNYQLVVGTNVRGTDESSCGIVRMYDVPNLMEDLTLRKQFGNMGKIVDIAYKERKKN